MSNTNTLLKTLNMINELITTASYYLNSTQGHAMLQTGRRDELVEYVTSLLAEFQAKDISRLDIKHLVAELLDRTVTDDHGWFIDVDSTNSNQITFVNPQRTKPEKRLVMPKTQALLAFELLG